MYSFHKHRWQPVCQRCKVLIGCLTLGKHHFLTAVFHHLPQCSGVTHFLALVELAQRIAAFLVRVRYARNHLSLLHVGCNTGLTQAAYHDQPLSCILLFHSQNLLSYFNYTFIHCSFVILSSLFLRSSLVLPSIHLLSSTYCCPVVTLLLSTFSSFVIQYITGHQPDNNRTTSGQELAQLTCSILATWVEHRT